MNLFDTFIFSLYSQNIKDLILKKNSDTAIKRILADYIYDIENVNNSANDDLSTFLSIIKPQILFLHLLRELNYNTIRQFLIKTKNIQVDINFLVKLFRYLSINCLKIFNIIGSDNYYYGIDKYYDYEIANNTDIILNITKEVEEFTIPDLINNIPDIIIIQRYNDDTQEASIVQEIITDENNERILNLNNIDKSNYNNIKSMKDIITFNNRKYKLEACIEITNDNNYQTYIYHKNKKYKNTTQTEWSNDFSTTINNIMAIYILQEQKSSSPVVSSNKSSSILTSIND